MSTQGARFLAVSANWMAAQQEAQIDAPVREWRAAWYATAPLGEMAAEHMDERTVDCFLAWLAQLPGGCA